MTEVQLDRYRDGESTVNVMVEVTSHGRREPDRKATEATRVFPDGRREKITGPALEQFLQSHQGQGRRVV